MIVSEQRVASIAGIPYQPTERLQLDEKSSLSELLKEPELRRRLFVLWIFWFSNALSVCFLKISENSHRAMPPISTVALLQAISS